MERNDQLPSGGCDICGAYAGETQSVLKKQLVRKGDAWVCQKCNKEQEE